MTTAEIKRIQGIVGTTQDGIMGPNTKNAIISYQRSLGVTADGIWGSNTEAAYQKKINPPVQNYTPAPSKTQNSTPAPTQNSSSSNKSSSSSSSSSSSTTLKSGSTGQAVKDLQTFLGIKSDGIFGPDTLAAVKAYQKANGLTVDGIVGPDTKAKMAKVPATKTTPTNQATPTNTQTQTNTPTPTQTPITQPDDPNNQYNTQTGEPNPNYVNAARGVEDYTKAGDTPTSYYNATERNTSAEQQNLGFEQGFSKIAGSSNLVSKNFLNTLSSDASIMAFYVNALTYGGYTMGDILNDMKRRELISQGGTNAAALKTLAVIDPEQNRSTYIATAEGQKATSDIATLIPTFNFQGLLNPEILKYGTNMPEDLFKTLVPILDPNSQEFKDAVEEVKSKYFDITSAQLQATTEQDKAVADYNLKQFKDQLKTNYGIALSDDASKAWTQIETLADTFASNGIANSGLHNEAVDKTLQSTRKADQRLRDERLTKDEQNKAAYYRASATDEEINKLTPEEREKLGLTPSADVANQFSIANLKAKNPSWTDEMVQQAHDAVIDKYGNYRSAIYSKYYGNIASTGQANQTTAVNAVTTDALNKEAKAYKDYTAETAFLGQTATGKNPNTSDPIPKSTDNGLSAAEDAAKKINESTASSSSNKTTPTPTNTINQATSSEPSSSTSTTGKNLTSKLTSDIQKIVGAKVDNIYGPETTAKVKAWQSANGLVADGIVGALTIAKMYPNG